ncbi:MAG TPA: exosortase F system-associated protein [Flavobacterium sp.]|nr:exosortase F system-associated protein [Flavobacterium sp.]
MPGKKRNGIRIVLAVLLVGALASIRLFERSLFYDPFLDFFHGEYQGKPLPEYDSLQLALGLMFRYTLNMVVSLTLLYVLFQSGSKLRFAALLYALLFVLLFIAFWIVLQCFDHNLLALFYVRRFLIQPLFIILFIPAFYFQDRQAANAE